MHASKSGWRDMDEAEITRHGFIVAGRQPSRVLEFIEAALDAVAQGIDVPSTGI